MMTTNIWGKPLTTEPPREARVISLEIALRRDGEAHVAGWVTAQNSGNVKIVDGSGELEFESPGLNAQVGDLVLCRLLLDSGRILSAEPTVVARTTDRARRVLETWDASDREFTYQYRYAQLRDPHHGR